MADDPKTPAQQLLDLVFFAPLGVAATIRDELPKLVKRGQQEANLAKMIGQFAVAQGKVEAEKVAKRLVARGTPAPRTSGNSVPTPSAKEAPAEKPAEPPVKVSVPVVDLDALGIPGYDSLSASQVVQRLAGLTPGELNAVEAYEASHRSRRTILNRVGQLRS